MPVTHHQDYTVFQFPNVMLEKVTTKNVNTLDKLFRSLGRAPAIRVDSYWVDTYGTEHHFVGWFRPKLLSWDRGKYLATLPNGELIELKPTESARLEFS